MERLPCDVSRITLGSTPNSLPILVTFSFNLPCGASYVPTFKRGRINDSLVPVLDDCICRIDDRAVHIEQQAIDSNDFWLRRKGRLESTERRHTGLLSLHIFEAVFVSASHG